ncbi:unnamed protein product [Thelazia callipaeda]|uniref:PPM-type phosphatase domain-containing protein n=1 Tax=Thelazia callipaeda TaxID=103827 RepID=A0A0N5CLN7_THECL|nr:unnamed protein product [Thelazia callipaeda]
MTTSSSSNIRMHGQHLRVNVAASQGGRKYMEDRVHIDCVRLPDGSVDYFYFAVYDGHGGSEASDYVRKHLLKNIQLQPGFNGSDEEMLDAIKKGFIETHLAMWKVVDEWPLTSSGYTSTAGTTATCAFIRRSKIFTGHVGDSAIILGEKYNGELKAASLTTDHKPDNSIEEKRISNAGGSVMKKSGVTRVVWTRPLRGHIGPIHRSTPTENIAFLAVARALGDLWSYNEETKQFIVSPEPDVAVHDLNDNQYCLVLGSDGLTNVLKPQQVVDIVLHYEKMSINKRCKPPNHSRWILRHALEGWGLSRADNISVITVCFEKECIDVCDELVLTDDVNLCLDEALTNLETSTALIGPSYCKQIETLDVDLFYAGVVDPNFTTAVAYRGPGYARDIKRPVTILQFSDVPILPVSSVNRVPAIRRIGKLFGTSDKIKVVPAECVSGVIFERMDGMHRNTINSNIPHSGNESIVREELIHNRNDNCMGFGRQSEHTEAVGTYVSNRESNSNVMQLKCITVGVGSTCRKRPANLNTNTPEQLETPLYQSLNINTEATKGRLVLKACRRPQARHFKHVIEQNEVKNDSRVGDSHSIRYHSHSNTHGNCFQDLISSQSVPGSASALSPSLMLTALRTTNQLFRHDPFSRDLILGGCHPFSHRFSSLPPEPVQKRFKMSLNSLVDKDHGSGISEKIDEKSRQGNIEVQKAEQGGSQTSTRSSRLWDFISTLLGNRANKK